MLQILLIILFLISLKIPHYAHYYSFYASYCYYSIAPIADNIMHKCCNVKLHVIIYSGRKSNENKYSFVMLKIKGYTSKIRYTCD